MGCCASPQNNKHDKRKEQQPIKVPEQQNLQQVEPQKVTQLVQIPSQNQPTKKKAMKQTQNLEAQKESLEAKNAIVVKQADKSIEDLKLILGAFSKIQIFLNLSDEDREIVIKEMNHYTLNDGEIVFEQGQPAKNFFVLISGVLQVLVCGKQVGTINPGEGFGEVALLHEIPRTATIKVLVSSTLWGVERDVFRKAIEIMNRQNFEQNLKFIEIIPLLQVLTPQQKESVAGSLITQKYSKGDMIVQEGNEGDRFFIIKEGTVQVKKNDLEIRRMYQGDFFGEMALLYDIKRTVSVIAYDNNVKCCIMMRETLNQLLGNSLSKVIYKNTQKIALESSKVLKDLTDEQIESVISCMKVEEYAPDQIVIQKGQQVSMYLFIIIKGVLKKSISGQQVVTSGQCLCDQLMLESSEALWDDDIIAQDEASIAYCTKEKFEESIGGTLEQILKNNELLKVVKDVQILRHINKEKLKQFLNALKVNKFSNGDIIVKQDQEGNIFFIVKKGKVDVIIDGKKVRQITKYDYFGERSLMFSEFRTATIIANGEVQCWSITKSDFEQIFEDKVREALLKRIELQDENITFENLQGICKLGKGMFGTVLLCKNKIKPVFYALKCVQRIKIMKWLMQENIKLERSILMQIDHPMIMKLVKTFKDDKRIYLLTELVRGLDLWDVLRKMDILNQQQARFYIGCMTLVLEYLHERDILYRDLKPENIIIDEQGYVKLIDLGTAKIIKKRTFTVVGTPHYMAPEVIIGKGYGPAIDVWSMGICLYEFLCGKVPFGDEEDDPYDIYEQILKYQLKFPFKPNHPSITFISQLLDKNPEVRTGGSWKNIKSNVWFNNFDWEKLIYKTLKPPFIPDLESLEQIMKTATPRDITQLIEQEDKIIQENMEEINKIQRKYAHKIPPDWEDDF